MGKRSGYVYEYKEPTQDPCSRCGLPKQDLTQPLCDECVKELAEYSDCVGLEAEQVMAQAQDEQLLINRRIVGKHGICGGTISYEQDANTWYLSCSKCNSKGSTLLLDLEDL